LNTSGTSDTPSVLPEVVIPEEYAPSEASGTLIEIYTRHYPSLQNSCGRQNANTMLRRNWKKILPQSRQSKLLTISKDLLYSEEVGSFSKRIILKVRGESLRKNGSEITIDHGLLDSLTK
jgi:hypothetical protein